MRRIAIDFAKLAVSAGLIWLAFSKIDTKGAFVLLASIGPPVVVFAVALLAGQHLFGALRFHRLLALTPTPISLMTAIDNVFVGFFFSQIFISFIGGDAIRVWRLRDSKVPVSAAVQAVLFDRVLGFVALIALIALSLPLLFDIVLEPSMRASIIATVLLGTLGTLMFLSMNRLPAFLRRWKIFQFAADTSLFVWTISRQFPAIVHLFGVSLLIQFLNVIAIFLIARGLGVQAQFVDFVLLVPPVMLLAILPISYAGWGVREGSMALALSLVGVAPEQSVAISICFGLAMIVSGMPGALMWLRRKGRDHGAKQVSTTTIK